MGTSLTARKASTVSVARSEAGAWANMARTFSTWELSDMAGVPWRSGELRDDFTNGIRDIVAGVSEQGSLLGVAHCDG